MKSFLLLSITVFAFCTFNGFSQIKVYDDNRVKIFGDRVTDDPNADLTVQIYGPYGDYLANGKLGFGTYGIEEDMFYDKRVFAGELGSNFDSDMLELCGSKGIHFTWGQGYDFNNIMGKSIVEWVPIFDVLTEVPKFYFETDVYAKGVILNSDERFKTNIKPLQNAISKLKHLNGVSYNLKNKQSGISQSLSSFTPTTDKERSDLELLAATKEKIKNMNRERIGFLAEEVQNVFPDLVEEDSYGFLHVDYIGLIPVLVESIKEQQNKIAILQNLLHTSKL